MRFLAYILMVALTIAPCSGAFANHSAITEVTHVTAAVDPHEHHPDAQLAVPSEITPCAHSHAPMGPEDCVEACATSDAVLAVSREVSAVQADMSRALPSILIFAIALVDIESEADERPYPGFETNTSQRSVLQVTSRLRI